jgi:SAM-dependent MidA family methyltransferase
MKVPPAEIIRREIKKCGVLPFARFMELALYCPETGYYETKRDNVGRRGDFYTSVSVGNLFGELLAFQFSEWLEEIKTRDSQISNLNLIEAGAHDGKLAKDILNWLSKNRPKLFSEMNYYIFEPSPRRQEWQQETLKKFTPKVRWFSNLFKVGRDSVEPESKKIQGIIFSNELLDAFPIQRFGWNAKEKKWFEFGVALETEKFIWAKIKNPGFVIQDSELDLPSELLEILPDNYTAEISEPAKKWWRDAANILQRGKLLTFDYGFTSDEQFSPARTNGTLRAYFRHHFADDILANVGEQDLTAHVNFSAIQKIGEKTGLKTDLFSTQTKFLTQILEKTLKEKSFDWNSARARQFQTLTHPEHLGRAFKVLVQSR